MTEICLILGCRCTAMNRQLDVYFTVGRPGTAYVSHNQSWGI